MLSFGSCAVRLRQLLYYFFRCDFTVGAWTPSWHPYANIETAKRGGFSWTWLPCAHYPVKTCPDVLAKHLKETIHKYD